MTVNTQNPADQAVLDEVEKQLAAGGDPFGDNGDEEQIVAAEAEAAQVEAATDAVDPEAKEAPAVETPPAETPTAEVVTETPPVEAPAPTLQPVTQYRTPTREAMETERERLYTLKEEAFQKVMDGELPPAEYNKLERQVMDSLLQISVQTTLAETNAQNAAIAEQNATLALAREAKAAGQIDYLSDVTAQKQFDVALNMLTADPTNAGKAYTEILQTAHRSVLALRGIGSAPAAPAAPVDKTPPARTPEKPPLTLRGLPTASTPNSGGTIADAMGRLKGAEYEAAYAKLTPAQQTALLDD